MPVRHLCPFLGHRYWGRIELRISHRHVGNENDLTRRALLEVIALDDFGFAAVCVALIDLLDEVRGLDDQRVSFPSPIRIPVASGQQVRFGDHAVAEVNATDFIVLFVDDHDLLWTLMDLHRIATRAEHRSRHARAEAVAAWRVAGWLHERLILGDLLTGCLVQRQRRTGAASAATTASLSRIVIGGPDAGEIRLLCAKLDGTEHYEDKGRSGRPRSRPKSSLHGHLRRYDSAAPCH